MGHKLKVKNKKNEKIQTLKQKLKKIKKNQELDLIKRRKRVAPNKKAGKDLKW